ncbi:UDP-N-acetylmuramoyl-L-alanine--D-glutamate ligase [Occallatibacter riparius]|uniref:UDP-N-acetylmuramoylalanine--D-glutamate ligase n=1 Tax=Occallatibacter riparius TaxID=1002689 RepID=A0A9J7BWC7_9BACT|nr:UDP-N-acetylmuramoyl-L-alanine--D-glutamate ligase [Occallatibacter riparius]UWZ87031.1 UDP-N-acetylmuramoyl-L-alanine--D-glutamate ligase [Occallatibacter riparius]
MDLKGKKVLVVGLGKSGLAAALFLRRRGAQVTVSDVRSAEALAREIPALIQEGIAVEAGGHGLLTFRRQDLIVVSPGVPVDTPELVQVRSFGLPVIGELELAARFLQGKVLAITGSNGKTTTTTLAGEILKESGLPTLVGGNIGVPVVALIDDSKPEGWSVLEVSSFQLETTNEFHPAIAVILNITPDHLDRHGTFENYALAKERIFARQTADDFLVLNADNPRAAEAASRAPSKVYWFSAHHSVPQGAWVENGQVVFLVSEGGQPEPILAVDAIPLKGLHNVENTLAAVCAARLAGCPAASVRSAVEKFKAVEHRLEFVSTINGVDFYNDSKATNVDATEKAIAAFPGGIHLILGGKDKNSDYTALAPLLRERVRAVYTIGSAAQKIESHLRGVVPLHSCQTLDNAVKSAANAARPGDIVLLAPACSSFDQFESYEHRGRVFKELVHEAQGFNICQHA